MNSTSKPFTPAYLILTFLLALCSFVNPASAQEGSGSNVYIKIDGANVKKSLVAVPPLQYFGSGTSPQYKKIGADLYNTIFNDLNVSGLFTFISPDAYLEDTNAAGLRPGGPNDAKGFKFENWSQIGTEFLVKAGYTIVQNNIELETYVYYIPQSKNVLAKKYSGSNKDLRNLAHKFSNDILEALTGKTGMFTSKIVLVSDRVGNSWKEVYTMDWDGYNVEKISNHKSISLSPTWSPDNKLIAYTAFTYHPAIKTRNADLLLYDTTTRTTKKLSTARGINSGAAFLPNGLDILFTMSQSGNPDIFKIGTNGTIKQRLTSGPRGAMNVEPAISPDGKKIAFSSDRSGRPMIYVMNIDGSDVKRITIAGRYNASPSWSPDSKQIAFAGFDAGHFDIFIVDADGMNLKRLTTAQKISGKGKLADNEDPSFSPDGRHIAFISNRTGKHQVYIVNPDGSNERRITFDNFNYFKPKWGKNTL